MDIVWDGVTKTGLLTEDGARLRQELAKASKNYHWPHVLKVISENRELVNATRPGGHSLYAPLHQAAHGGAPKEVVDQLIRYGAWRTLQNSIGERPIDVAVRQGHKSLAAQLEPQYKHHVPIGVLLKIQAHFHVVILGRAKQLVDGQSLRLPELEPLLELEKPSMWFPVPGMYGGFSYRLETCGVTAELISESWCRVSGGSGQRHAIGSAGSKLVEEGFV